jgi:S1-C subfamily serine protease
VAAFGVGTSGWILGIRNSAQRGASAASTSSSTRLVLVTSTRADVAKVAAAVDPAIVDITTTLAFGAGTAAGTGMVITSNGDILTNNHVVEDAVSIHVAIPGRGTFVATVVGTDVAADVAVLEVHGLSGLTTVRFATATPGVGTSVVAIGNALGRGGTPTPVAGSVQALGQTITASTDFNGVETLRGLIETTAPIQSGDSGGPLLDASGTVLGMDTAANTSGRTAATRSFAIPMSEILPVVEKMLSGSGGAGITMATAAFLGVQTVATHQGLRPLESGPGSATSVHGLLVLGVIAGSPAANAGIAPGDVITRFAGTVVQAGTDLKKLVIAHHPGSSVSITYTGVAGSTTVEVTLVAGPVA